MRLTLALSGLISLAACADLAPATDETPGVAKSSQALAAALTAEDEVACKNRYAGIRAVAACPAGAGGWQLMPAALTPSETGPLPDRMNAYCVYEWQAAGSAPGAPVVAGVDQLAPDCHAVSSAAEITVEVGQFMTQTFHRGADRPPSLPANLDPTLLAIVDSSPTQWSAGTAGDGQYDHGRTVAMTARGIACNSGTCAADILSVLGLPRVTPKTTAPLLGGHFGYQSELARGIYEAVDMWGTGLHSRLVINLSVGWEARFGGAYTTAPSELPPAIRMVYDAIQYARCRGAIVVAAVGNRGNFSDSGPLYPAAWTASPAPTAGECTGITSAYPNDIIGAPPNSLLVAVAGVTRHDTPLHNARSNTRTEIEAPGANITTWDPENSEWRTPLTGSSMSAGAVSAAASTIWAYRPQTPPHEIVKMLYDSGIDLGVTADVCPGASCGNARRLSTCAALNQMCSLLDSTCSGSLTCALVPAGTDYAPSVSETDRTIMNTAIDVDVDHGVFPNLLEFYTSCDGIDIYYDGTANQSPDEVCVASNLGFRARPWVTPQPDGLGCDICYFSNHMAYIRINPSDSGSVAKSPVIYLSDGYSYYGFDLGAISTNLTTLTPGTTYKIELGLSTTVKEAWIEFVINDILATDSVVVY